MKEVESNKKRKIIMLTVTESCNLNCIYCYEHNKSGKKMSFEKAKEIIDHEFEIDDGFDEIEIDFFGGEPFIEFELMKKIHDYVFSLCSPKQRLCFAITNGTYVNDEAKKWLKEHKETFCVGISLDGTREMHNINRKTSKGKGNFDDIDIDFFRSTWPFQDIKMTVSKETLPYLAEGIKYIQGLGFACGGSFAYGIDWDLENSLPILKEQLELLVEYYIENPDIPIAGIINRDIQNIEYNLESGFKWCGAGTNMKCYDINGKMFPCQFFMGLSIGELSEITQQIFNEHTKLVDEKCANCKIYSICPTCYGMNYSVTGKLYERDNAHCEMNKLIILANAKIQYFRITSKSELTQEDYYILKAIKDINNLL